MLGSSAGINNSWVQLMLKVDIPKVKLDQQITLYIYVGESGYASSSTANNTKSGFNGGGKGYLNQQVMGNVNPD
ncbi:glycine-rich protein [Clostridioides difficile]